MYLGDLDRGTKYSLILVATTGTESTSLETESNMVVLKTAGQGNARKRNQNIYLLLYLLPNIRVLALLSFSLVEI
jgi:hypothetical protein